MTQGVILFAFNSTRKDSTQTNYYEMAKYTAKRINHFLKLPVTLVTDMDSYPKDETFLWDKVCIVEADKSNSRETGEWINKGRFQAYDLSPYDETIILDVDYVVNSSKLLKIFDFYDDFCCHNHTSFLMHPEAAQEQLSVYSKDTLWATVIAFKKTSRTKQIFECLEMVQKNYEHYANIHAFVNGAYRNDYGLTIALSIVNGHLEVKQDYIPWSLMHVGKQTQVYCNYDSSAAIEDSTSYTVMFDNWKKGKIRKEYIYVNDQDFHVIDKEVFVDLITND